MLGIVCSVFMPGFQVIAATAASVLMILLIVFSFLKRKLFLKFNWFYGLIIVWLCFGIGYLRLFTEKDDTKTNHLMHYEDIEAYRAVVVSQPVQKGKFYRSTIRLKSAKTKEWEPAIGKVNLYVRASQLPFRYGDELLVEGRPQRVSGPKNPEEFNYRRYLSFLNVFHQQFADSMDVHILSHEQANAFISTSIRVRSYFSSLLHQYIEGNKELAIANALLLGNKDELDNEIKNTYAASGAMHVLAVSGLHVGIIYLIILVVLKYTLRERKKEWIVAVVAIPLLWGYAFITGLSPSVLRAVTLFSILALGRAVGRKADMVNMLAVSAFILLMYNPFLLMQVGFQLSYVAVLGIIYIYPIVRKLWMPSSRLCIFIWDITAISIAAQVATFPLSILYFHRFAPYFLVSNLLVIPAATIMVWLGVLLFSTSWVSTVLAGWLGVALEELIRLVNYVLSGIYHLPGSNWDSLYLDIPQTWVLYLIIFGFILFVVQQKNAWAVATSLGIVALTVLIGVRWVQNNRTQQLVVYDIPNHYAIDFIQSGSVQSIMDSSLMKMEDNIHFHIKPQRLLKGTAVQKTSVNLAWKQLPQGKVIVWNGISVFIRDVKAANQDPSFDFVLNSKSNQSNGAVLVDVDNFHSKHKN